MEEVFAQARDAEASAEELLVDDGWKAVEVEPETIAVNGNGTNGHHANGHDDLFIFGPTVELAPVNGNGTNGSGHAPVPVNGNGVTGHHDDEADEPQQSLFSWAEFMAEPVKPKRRNGKPQPASQVSMFEWAHGAGAGTGDGRRGTLDRSSRGSCRQHWCDGLPAHGKAPSQQHRKETRPMARIFVYDDREFPDPDPEMTVDQVKGTLADFYGEIANASVKETKRGDDTIYEFQRRVGTKGAFDRPRS